MLKKTIDDLISDTFTDPNLRNKLKDNLEATVRLGGYDLNEEEMEILRHFIKSEWSDFPVKKVKKRVVGGCCEGCSCGT